MNRLPLLARWGLIAAGSPLRHAGPRARGVHCLVLALGTLLLASQARAVLPDEQLADPALEARARAIGGELRCVVCQNQTIDDSDAELARDLRIILRERLTAGDSDKQAIAFIVARYGSFVLLKPPFDAQTLLLWLGPLLVLGAGGTGVTLYLRRRMDAAGAAPAALTDAERAKLDELLGGDAPP